MNDNACSHLGGCECLKKTSTMANAGYPTNHRIQQVDSSINTDNWLADLWGLRGVHRPLEVCLYRNATATAGIKPESFRSVAEHYNQWAIAAVGTDNSANENACLNPRGCECLKKANTMPNARYPTNRRIQQVDLSIDADNWENENACSHTEGCHYLRC